MLKFRSILTAGVAVMALAACGADEVSSPGGGSITINNPANGGGNTGGNTGGGTVTPADSCPTGTTDAGTISGGDGSELRNCRIGNGSADPIITENLSLPNQSGTVYSLNGSVQIGVDVGGDGNKAGGDAATLQIDPGVIVFAENLDSFLVVNRGSKLNAIGTASKPIIFTSRSNVVGSVSETSDTQWGGVVLLGRAPISNCNAAVTGGTDACEAEIEGVGGTSVPLFGGGQADDSSGTLKYVQIRFSGKSLKANSELQGLTTGGVGRGTTLSYLQVHNSSDDGVESFGGRQNMDHLVFTGVVDDSVDIDDGYQGAIQYVIAARRVGGDETSDPRVLELDSTGDSAGKPVDALPRTYLRLANFTFVSDQNYEVMALRGGADAALLNGIVVNTDTTSGSCMRVYDQTDLAVEERNITAAGNAPEERGPAQMEAVVFDCATDFKGDDDGYAATIFGNGDNADYSSTLQQIVSGVAVENGTNEQSPPVTPVSDMSIYRTDAYSDDLPTEALDQVDYIGAVRDANDTWYLGWTCDSVVIDFGNDQDCTELEFN